MINKKICTHKGRRMHNIFCNTFRYHQTSLHFKEIEIILLQATTCHLACELPIGLLFILTFITDKTSYIRKEDRRI